jgi:hypothetical protein
VGRVIEREARRVEHLRRQARRLAARAEGRRRSALRAHGVVLTDDGHVVRIGSCIWVAQYVGGGARVATPCRVVRPCPEWSDYSLEAVYPLHVRALEDYDPGVVFPRCPIFHDAEAARHYIERVWMPAGYRRDLDARRAQGGQS